MEKKISRKISILLFETGNYTPLLYMMGCAKIDAFTVLVVYGSLKHNEPTVMSY